MRAWLLGSAAVALALAAVACGDPSGDHPADGDVGGGNAPGGGGTGNTGKGGNNPGGGGTTPGGGGTNPGGGGTNPGGGGTDPGGGAGTGSGTGGSPPLDDRCSYPGQGDEAEVKSAYNTWKGKFVTSNGAGGNLRVQRPENQNDTVSEGIAYGMLMAAYLDDRPTLDGLWAYAKAHMGGGVMHWQINSSGSTIGTGGATDADEDMAWALLVAAKKWGGTYEAEAKSLIGTIFTTETSGGAVKAGNQFGDQNISYYAPAYYRVFGKVTGNESGWNAVVEWVYGNIAQHRNATTGLVPNWNNGGGPGGYQDRKDGYGIDACRTPWRIAQDYCWNGEPRAKELLDKMSTFFSPIGAANIVDGYELAGKPYGTNKESMAFVGPAGVGAMGSRPNLASSANLAVMGWLLQPTAARYSYYNASWGVLSAMMFSGVFAPL